LEVFDAFFANYGEKPPIFGGFGSIKRPKKSLETVF